MHVTTSTLHCFCNLLHRGNCLYKPLMLYIYRYCFGHYWKCIVHFLDSLAWPAEFPFFCFVSALLKTPKTPGRCDSPFLTGCSSRWFRFPVLCAQAKYHGAQDVRGAPRGGGRVVQPKTVQAAETQHFYRGNHDMLCVEINLAPCQRIGLCFWLILDDVDAHGNMANHFKLDHYGEQYFFTIWTESKLQHLAIGQK